jgi:hypothetical protein
MLISPQLNEHPNCDTDNCCGECETTNESATKLNEANPMELQINTSLLTETKTEPS